MNSRNFSVKISAPIFGEIFLARSSFFSFRTICHIGRKNRNRVIVRLTPTDPNRPPAGDPTPVGWTEAGRGGGGFVFNPFFEEKFANWRSLRFKVEEQLWVIFWGGRGFDSVPFTFLSNVVLPRSFTLLKYESLFLGRDEIRSLDC